MHCLLEWFYAYEGFFSIFHDAKIYKSLMLKCKGTIDVMHSANQIFTSLHFMFSLSRKLVSSTHFGYSFN